MPPCICRPHNKRHNQSPMKVHNQTEHWTTLRVQPHRVRLQATVQMSQTPQRSSTIRQVRHSQPRFYHPTRNYQHNRLTLQWMHRLASVFLSRAFPLQSLSQPRPPPLPQPCCALLVMQLQWQLPLPSPLAPALPQPMWIWIMFHSHSSPDPLYPYACQLQHPCPCRLPH